MKPFVNFILGGSLCAALLAGAGGCAVGRKAADAATQADAGPGQAAAAPPANPAAPPASGQPSPNGSPQAAPPAAPLVSYLKDGSLWAARADGSEQRQLVAAPENRAITYHAWSADGGRIYFNVGLELYAYRLKEQKVDALGVLPAPPTAAVDRLEAAREGDMLLVRTLSEYDALGAPPKIYAYAAGQFRELGVDEYQSLAPARAAVVRGVGEMSVSPDGGAVLFWEVVGADEQLFVSHIETGARMQITELGMLDGFDETAGADGVRRLIEATWSPDGEHVVFIPAQSCSEAGFCFGRMYLVSRWGGPPLQLAGEATTNLSAEWDGAGALLAYDDQGRVLVADTRGQIRQIAEGNQPRWQPTS